MMLDAFAETIAAAVPQRSCQFLPCCQCGILFSALKKLKIPWNSELGK
jgi:hypothetical protein